MKLETAIQTNVFRDDNHKAGLNILYTAWWLKTLMSRELKQFGLTHEQYNVLRILKGKAPDAMCVKDIASRLIEKSSNVPRIIDRLVVKKLVKRSTDPADKRHTVMALTPAGMNLLEQSTRSINAVFTQYINMEPAQARQLNRLLEQFRQNEES